MDIKVQNWYGYDIRFVKYCGTWYAVAKDIVDALQLKDTYYLVRNINPRDIRRVSISQDIFHPHNSGAKYSDGRGHQLTRPMLVINEHGIYQALFRSRRLEARQFTDWVCEMLEHMRTAVGLRPYEVMRMTEPEIQRDIDEQFGEAFYDPEMDSWRIQRTTENGDVLVYDKE